MNLIEIARRVAGTASKLLHGVAMAVRGNPDLWNYPNPWAQYRKSTDRARGSERPSDDQEDARPGADQRGNGGKSE